MGSRPPAPKAALFVAGLVAAPLLIHAVLAVDPDATLLAFLAPGLAAAGAAALRLVPLAAGLVTGGLAWVALLYLVLSGLQT